MARNRWGKEIRRLCGLPILTDYFRPERGFFARGDKAFVLCALIYPASGTAAVLLSAVRKISISKR